MTKKILTDRITALDDRIAKLESCRDGQHILNVSFRDQIPKLEKGQDPEPSGRGCNKDIQDLSQIIARQETEITTLKGSCDACGKHILRQQDHLDYVRTTVKKIMAEKNSALVEVEQLRTRVETQRGNIQSVIKDRDLAMTEILGLRAMVVDLKEEIKGLKDGTSVDFWKGMAERNLQEVERLRKLLGR